MLERFYRLVGHKMSLISVGGIAPGPDAYAKIRAGASLVQLYSTFVYDGPGLAQRIKQDLAALLKRDGLILWLRLSVCMRIPLTQRDSIIQLTY